jgi:mRNA interferase MazF
MTVSRFGDVVLVSFPFTDQTDQKKRPAVVVSSAAYHRERSDLILMAVSSQIRPPSTFGERLVSGWKEAGLLRPSVLKPVLFTVERNLVLRKLGYLRRQDLDSVREGLAEILGPFEGTSVEVGSPS